MEKLVGRLELWLSLYTRIVGENLFNYMFMKKLTFKADFFLDLFKMLKYADELKTKPGPSPAST